LDEPNDVYNIFRLGGSGSWSRDAFKRTGGFWNGTGHIRLSVNWRSRRSNFDFKHVPTLVPVYQREAFISAEQTLKVE